mmetsp:Transcript_96458/g.191064  ORF Transcript_96458/g.191064 Transcript_96458/m.191064 type:complete len:177 (+) Transcript_96458:273-803(+)
MKPAWDKLIHEFNGSTSILVADVDCTAAGKSKCEEVGVRGYPTIKYGDPNDLQDYKGGRSFDELKQFASGLQPGCGPYHLDKCDEAKKTEIAKLQAMPKEGREALIKEKEGIISKLEEEFKEFQEGLNKKYKEESAKKEKAIEEIKASGLGLMKQVHNLEKKKQETVDDKPGTKEL